MKNLEYLELLEEQVKKDLVNNKNVFLQLFFIIAISLSGWVTYQMALNEDWFLTVFFLLVTIAFCVPLGFSIESRLSQKSMVGSLTSLRNISQFTEWVEKHTAEAKLHPVIHKYILEKFFQNPEGCGISKRKLDLLNLVINHFKEENYFLLGTIGEVSVKDNPLVITFPFGFEDSLDKERLLEKMKGLLLPESWVKNWFLEYPDSEAVGLTKEKFDSLIIQKMRLKKFVVGNNPIHSVNELSVGLEVVLYRNGRKLKINFVPEYQFQVSGKLFIGK